MNDTPERFDRSTIEKLGSYVYALLDPENHVPFYIGKGRGVRVLSHLRNSETNDQDAIRKKDERIADIRRRGQEPIWVVLAHNLPEELNEVTAFIVEAAVIYALKASPMGTALVNENDGMHLQKYGGMSVDEVARFKAPKIRSTRSYPCILLFNIANEFQRSKNAYDATRGIWPLGTRIRSLKDVVAIGLDQGISRIAITVDTSSWTKLRVVNKLNKEKWKWQFEGRPDDQSELVERNWATVLEKAKGYWQRGSPLAVEMSEDNRFRFLHGHRDQVTWWSL